MKFLGFWKGEALNGNVEILSKCLHACFISGVIERRCTKE